MLPCLYLLYLLNLMISRVFYVLSPSFSEEGVNMPIQGVPSHDHVQYTHYFSCLTMHVWVLVLHTGAISTGSGSRYYIVVPFRLGLGAGTS